MVAWTQCRTRLTLITRDGPWRVALEEAQADSWRRIKEWSFAEKAGVDATLAALGLAADQIASFYTNGALELSG